MTGVFSFYRNKNLLALIAFVVAFGFFTKANSNSEFTEENPKPNSLVYFYNVLFYRSVMEFRFKWKIIKWILFEIMVSINKKNKWNKKTKEPESMGSNTSFNKIQIVAHGSNTFIKLQPLMSFEKIIVSDANKM